MGQTRKNWLPYSQATLTPTSTLFHTQALTTTHNHDHTTVANYLAPLKVSYSADTVCPF